MAALVSLIALLVALYMLFLVLKFGAISCKALWSLSRYGVITLKAADSDYRLVIQRSDLWSINGKVGRGPYLTLGIILVAIKYNLDRFLSFKFSGDSWHFFHYLIPSSTALSINSLDPNERNFLVTMVALSLPFLWTGVALTIRRLRDLAAPRWLVILFFVPVINLLFFIVLSVLPSKIDEREYSKSSFLVRVIPRNKGGSAAFAILLGIAIGTILVTLSTLFLGSYGWGLFVGVPFAVGMFTSLIYSFHEKRSLKECIEVATLTVIMISVALLTFALEGAICIVMAAPLAWIVTVIGAVAGYHISERVSPSNSATVSVLVVVAIPLLGWWESLNLEQPAPHAVTTSIIINQPREKIWPNIISFPELTSPSEWVFKTGIAYPIRAYIDGQGVGAVRHCEFTTGSFVEPIEIWNAPHLLKFSVRSQPAIMDEASPFAPIHPAHIENYLVSSGGQFLLTDLGNATTRIEATTWYSHRIWPQMYWGVWSDFIIHMIHQRVLNHVAALSSQGKMEQE